MSERSLTGKPGTPGKLCWQMEESPLRTDSSPVYVQGPVVGKMINLIQDYRKLLFYVFNFFVKVSFAYFSFSRLTSSNVKFCRISALNSIWELRNKLLF